MRKRRGPYRLHGYVVLLLATGIQPEQARALRWDLVDLEAGTVAVWRSDRLAGHQDGAVAANPEVGSDRGRGADGTEGHPGR